MMAWVSRLARLSLFNDPSLILLKRPPQDSKASAPFCLTDSRLLPVLGLIVVDQKARYWITELLAS